MTVFVSEGFVITLEMCYEHYTYKSTSKIAVHLQELHAISSLFPSSYDHRTHWYYHWYYTDL